jgi:hypothetical protein
MTDRSKYLIRLNGMPFLEITCPDDVDPLRVAREYLDRGTWEEDMLIEEPGPEVLSRG